MGVDDLRTETFSQSEILGMKKAEVTGTSAEKGVCQELCWKWMKRLKTKSNKYSTATDRMNALWKDATVDKAIDRHNSATQLSVPQQFYNIPKDQYQFAFKYDDDMISKWQLKGGGMFYSVFCPKYNNEKHAIAAWLSPNPLNPSLLFFDPNEGEYKMGAGRFYGFFADFLKEKYNADKSNVAEIVYYKP